ncbi:MAG: hypothetical protein BWX80_03253 [Candidatus Hydrogenedentes bacterium ADurb.Bin101]|nr:MAG: hypothetical protein BWX80_03253 [Candidatus Hydrogenedentes bacterium ADurb.Bin101]
MGNVVPVTGLIQHAPDDHRRMVTVPKDHFAYGLFTSRLHERRLFNPPDGWFFIHQHAEFICQFQKDFRGGLDVHPYQVESGRFRLFNLLAGQRIDFRRGKAARIIGLIKNPADKYGVMV